MYLFIMGYENDQSLKNQKSKNLNFKESKSNQVNVIYIPPNLILSHDTLATAARETSPFTQPSTVHNQCNLIFKVYLIT